MAASKTTTTQERDERLAELEQRIGRLEFDLSLTLGAIHAPEDAVKIWPKPIVDLGDDG